MREIKFRAWVSHIKDMIQITNQLSFHHPENTAHVPYYTPKNTLADAELMQYTGLKDKTGVEIYEGDIVYSDGMQGKICISAEQTLEIFWGDGCWLGKEVISKFRIGTKEDLRQNKMSRFEIIGNIHESPELLK